MPLPLLKLGSVSLSLGILVHDAIAHSLRPGSGAIPQDSWLRKECRKSMDRHANYGGHATKCRDRAQWVLEHYGGEIDALCKSYWPYNQTPHTEHSAMMW